MADFNPARGKTQGVSPGQFAGLGLQFAVAILVFLFLGQWLDKKFGTAPVFLIGCVFVGAGTSFYAMYRKLMASLRDEESRRAKGKGEK